METNYRKDIYAQRLENGNEYQDYICNELSKHGIIIQNYCSQKYQHKGENRQGLEIKLDRKFRSTGNLYIEIAEKSNPDREYYTESGIYRKDNSRWYGIGDYQTFYWFSKQQLRCLWDKKASWLVEFQPTPTSQGFGFPVNEVEFWAEIFEFEE
jgi:hypothetical protein